MHIDILCVKDRERNIEENLYYRNWEGGGEEREIVERNRSILEFHSTLRRTPPLYVVVSCVSTTHTHTYIHIHTISSFFSFFYTPHTLYFVWVFYKHIHKFST